MKAARMKAPGTKRKAGLRKPVRFSRWDPVDHLTTCEECVAYLDACIDEAPEDARLLVTAIGNVARARGVPEVTGELGKDSNPSLGTVMKVMKALGLRFRVVAA